MVQTTSDGSVYDKKYPKKVIVMCFHYEVILLTQNIMM
jgi:hypothetical protein